MRGNPANNTVYAATTTVVPSVEKPKEKPSSILAGKLPQPSHEQALVLCVLAASLGSFCSGLFVGWSSHGSVSLVTKYSTNDVARITSYLALGAAVSPLVAHSLWPRTGTKAAVIASCLVMCTSIIGLFVDYGFVCLLVARFASGLAIGVIQLLMPAYVQDIIKCAVQPTTTTTTTTTTAATPMPTFANDVFHLQFVLGVLTMFVTALLDQYLPHLACIVMVVATIVFTIAACLLPESPRYLCQHCPGDAAGLEAASQILQQFTPANQGDGHISFEPILQQWCSASHGVRDLWRAPSGTMRPRTVFAAMGAVALSQLMGLTGALLYMEKLLSLSFITVYSPPTNAAICALCLTAATGMPLFVRLPDTRRMLVRLTVATTVALGLFGLHCHYRGTFGPYTTQHIFKIAPAATDDDSDDWSPLLPLLLIGGALALYALGPMRLSGGGEAASLDADLWRSMVPVRQEMAVRSVLLTVGWLSVFGVGRVLPGLVNAVGMGWLMWFLMVNGAIASVYLAWWVRNIAKESNRATTPKGDAELGDGGDDVGLVVEQKLGATTVVLC